jgi:hypothetical protein
VALSTNAGRKEGKAITYGNLSGEAFRLAFRRLYWVQHG